MKASQPTIQTQMDANWYLAIATELTPVLPIDVVLKELERKYPQFEGDEGIREARRAVHAALMEAERGPRFAAMRQANRKMTPKFLEGLASRGETILEAYRDIQSALLGKGGRAALNNIEASFAESVPDENAAEAIRIFRSTFQEFVYLEKPIADFIELLRLAKLESNAKKGRRKEAPYYFVKSLALSWWKITGEVPKRTYDPIEGVEKGHFHTFCSAAADTVTGYLPIRSIDAAVRRAIEEWDVPIEAP